jgi:DNA-binding transcriptional MocR family regulator
VHRAGESYERRRDGLVDALAAHGVAAHGHTGINVWIPVPDETLVVTALRDAGWSVAPGAPNRIAAAPGVRITVSSLDEADLGPLAEAVARALRPTTTGFTA